MNPVLLPHSDIKEYGDKIIWSLSYKGKTVDTTFDSSIIRSSGNGTVDMSKTTMNNFYKPLLEVYKQLLK
jgi:hypothetical protein